MLAMASGICFGGLFNEALLEMTMPVALFFIIYPAMLDVDLRQMKRAIHKPGLMLTALVMNFLLSPLLIVGLLHLLLAEQDQNLMVGLVLFGIMPSGNLAPAFTKMLRGNVTLSTAILTLSLLLSIGIVPLWTKLLIGVMVPVPFVTILKYLFVIIWLPMIMARLTRRILIRRKGGRTYSHFRKRLEKSSSFGLMFFLFIVFSLTGRQVIDNPVMILKILCPVLLFLLLLIAISILVGRLLVASHEDTVSLTMSITPKNNSVAMALAFSAFGADVALVNAIAGPLVQLPLMLGYIRFSKKYL